MSVSYDNMALCTLQELYSDMQRTTEQLVKDKLEEQKVSSALPSQLHMPHAGSTAFYLIGCGVIILATENHGLGYGRPSWRCSSRRSTS